MKRKLEEKNKKRLSRLMATAQGNPSERPTSERPSTQGITLPHLVTWSEERSRGHRAKAEKRKMRRKVLNCCLLLLGNVFQVEQRVQLQMSIDEHENLMLQKIDSKNVTAMRRRLKQQEMVLREKLEELQAHGVDETIMAGAQAALDNMDRTIPQLRKAMWLAQSESLDGKLRAKGIVHPSSSEEVEIIVTAPIKVSSRVISSGLLWVLLFLVLGVEVMTVVCILF